MGLPDYADLYTSQEGFRAVMNAYQAEIGRGPVPYHSRRVHTRYGDTHILCGGMPSAPPLFLFHDWHTNAASIGAAFPFLFSSYQVFMPDIIGQLGKSAPTRPPTGGPAYADWVSDLFRALSVEKAVVIGVSGGSWVTLKVAAYAPRMIDKAIVIAPVGLAHFRSPIHRLRRILLCRLAGMMPGKAGQRWAARILAGPGLSSGPAFDTYAARLAHNFKYSHGPVLPGTLTDDELRHITAPIMIMVGENDQHFNPLTIQYRARKLIPGERDVLIFPNTGHLLMEENPVAARTYILAFLQSQKEPWPPR